MIASAGPLAAALAAPFAEQARSPWQIHRGHILLLLAWLLIVGVVLLAGRIRGRRAARSTVTAGPDAARPAGPSVLPRGVWVWLAAAATVASAAIHLSVIGEHFGESTLYGTFFLVLTVVQFGWAAGLLLRPTVPLFAAGGAGSLGVALLWLATRTVGIPLGAAAGEKEAVGSIDLAASLAEVVVAACALAAIWAAASARARPALTP